MKVAVQSNLQPINRHSISPVDVYAHMCVVVGEKFTFEVTDTAFAGGNTRGELGGQHESHCPV